MSYNDSEIQQNSNERQEFSKQDQQTDSSSSDTLSEMTQDKHNISQKPSIEAKLGCATGPLGATVPVGATGPKNATGPVGATGPSGDGLAKWFLPVAVRKLLYITGIFAIGAAVSHYVCQLFRKQRR